jgi:hypothetical protein
MPRGGVWAKGRFCGTEGPVCGRGQDILSPPHHPFPDTPRPWNRQELRQCST